MTGTSNAPVLLPCPFCAYPAKWANGQDDRAGVNCTNKACDASSYYVGHETWNRRSLPAGGGADSSMGQGQCKDQPAVLSGGAKGGEPTESALLRAVRAYVLMHGTGPRDAILAKLDAALP